MSDKILPSAEWEAMTDSQREDWMTWATKEIQLPQEVIDRLLYLSNGHDPFCDCDHADISFAYLGACTCGHDCQGWDVQISLSWVTLNGYGMSPEEAVTDAVMSPISILN